jgi:hypothetical protein
MAKYTIATALAAGVATAFLVLSGVPGSDTPAHKPAQKNKQTSQIHPLPATQAKPPAAQGGAASAAKQLFAHYGEPLYGVTVQALSTDASTLAARHQNPGGISSTRDIIACRDGMIAADMAVNIMAVSYAYNLLVQHKVAPYHGEEQIMPYYPFAEDIGYLSAQLMHLRVACKNILPAAGYIPEYDIMNSGGAEVRNTVSTALEEMSFHLGDLSDRMLEKPGTIQISDLAFCLPMHDLAAALRPAMRERPSLHHNKDHAANFDDFYGALKNLCPQYGPIY